MPISENELMWSQSLPEEVRVDEPETVAELTVGESGPGAGAAAEAEDVEPVLRTGGVSGLEATLARLEMSSLAIKMHLDSLEQRIGRMEPLLQERSRAVEATEGAEVAAVEGSGERAGSGGEVAAEEVAEDAEAPALSMEAKEKRWSHLIGPEQEALMAAAGLAQAERPVGARAAVAEPLRPVAGKGAEQPTRPVAQEKGLTGEATEVGVARPMWMTEAADRSVGVAGRLAGEAGGAAGVARGMVAGAEPGGSPAAAASPAVSEQGLAAENGWPRGPIPEPRVPSFGAVGTSREGLFGPRVMGAPDDLAMEEENEQKPRTWRGYQRRHLVWALVLLVLAAIPLLIWWRLSTEARDADAGDAAPVSQVEPAVAPLPMVGRRGGESSSRAVGRTMPRSVSPVRSVGPMQSGNGPVAGWVGNGGGAPVIRRQPEAVASGAEGGTAVVAGLNARTVGGRTSSGTTSGVGLRGQPDGVAGGADEIPGRSGMRVRVPEGVMEEHLLPTGDVGELPRGSGEVVAAVFISNTGRVEAVQVISGGEGLRGAAARAIRNWRYEPYVQNGVRVPVVTTASIRFGGETVGDPQ